MKIKKLLAIICVAALLVTTLAGCVGKTDKPGGTVPSSGQTQPPTNPSSSPIIVKIKSVCGSEIKLPFLTEVISLLYNPFPHNWPEPIAILAFVC